MTRLRELIGEIFVPACQAMGLTPNVTTRMYSSMYENFSSRSVLEAIDKEFALLPADLQKVVTPTRLKAIEVTRKAEFVLCHF
jgi:hypothetical protein